MRKSKTERMVVLALLSAFAYMLLLFDFPVLLTFSWLKLDFSDIPILIGTFIYGPVGGIVIAFIRSTLKFITSGGNLPSLIGNVTGFLASVVYMLPIYYMTKQESSNKNLVKGMIVGSTCLTLFMGIANYFVITPIYLYVLGMDFGIPISKMVLYGVIPFNIIKGAIVSVVFMVTYKKLLPVIQRKMTVI
ncbi:MAG: ECF transporter S component [Vagococcus sp.]